MSVKCNMTPEEREKWGSRFPSFLSNEEEEAARGAFTRYIFYETWGRRDFREYYCWQCGRFEAVRGQDGFFYENPFAYKHGDRGECPNCRANGHFVALGRCRTMRTLTEWRNVGFIRAVDGALLLSAGSAVREYSHNDLDPVIEYYEKARYALTPGRRQKWDRVREWEGCGYYTGTFPVPAKSFTEPFPRTHWWGSSIRSGEVYWVGADNIAESDLKYCQAEEFMRDVWGVERGTDTGELEAVRGLILYLGEYSRRPQIEMLYKLGHGDVINALIQDGSLNTKVVDWRAKTPAGFFRMSRAEYRQFREAKGKYRDLIAYHERTDGTGGMSWSDYLCLCAWLPRSAGTFFTAAQEHGVTAQRLWHYLQEQAPIGADGEETYGIWKDYLDMARKLERDMTFRRNLFPEDLRREHDGAAELLVELGNEREKETYGKRFKRLKRKYAWSDGELQIVVPVNSEDIVREGKRLHHCVGGYAERHIEGKTTILFLRKCSEPRERYVTIEINDATNEIRQVHGYRNEADGAEPPMQRHKAFFDTWLAWLRAGSHRSRNGKPVRVKTEKEAKTA